MFCLTFSKYRKKRNFVNLDFAVKLRTPESTPRIISCNAETYRFFWPYLFSRNIPAARPFAQWAASNGASVFPRIRLKMRPSGRCFLTATRLIKRGTPLITLPRFLCLEAAPLSNDGNSRAFVSFEERYSVIAKLTTNLARYLHNPKSEFREYVEFLYDIHNAGTEDSLSKERIDWNEMFCKPSPLQQTGVISFSNQNALQQQLEVFYSGNVVHSKGVHNAPFLLKETFKTPFGRVEWSRMQRLLREVKQGVPHFAAPSVSWALSMVLSRSFGSQLSIGKLIMCPFIDFCEHSYNPNSAISFSHATKENRKLGVLWHDDEVPCVHLRSTRDIAKGEPITVLYSSRPSVSPEDREYWQVYWGFIPSKTNI